MPLIDGRGLGSHLVAILGDLARLFRFWLDFGSIWGTPRPHFGSIWIVFFEVFFALLLCWFAAFLLCCFAAFDPIDMARRNARSD